uniref:Uncharacterized protein n=1 Tax=Chromera velia CCMP2878 TaxID=1169474 RepID=A0A0G4F3D4_9ALVE|eukprot:Cvel_14887.t1-p1 / transcript=Cvel_14887.t1 / gene=Cvel_14887 / organism=Chromera_velia_CCMP2878 / gene_product=hypothetical protein / transcript_product=hypothetical protein / location=Cvel_scaffold1077:26157-34995(-) / protein_length=1211 / sequence_SO=supercontig / SO=protein_coding / is_pseudo=false
MSDDNEEKGEWKLPKDAVNLIVIQHVQQDMESKKPTATNQDNESQQKQRDENRENQMIGFLAFSLQFICVIALRPALFNLDNYFFPKQLGWRTFIPGYTVTAELRDRAESLLILTLHSDFKEFRRIYILKPEPKKQNEGGGQATQKESRGETAGPVLPGISRNNEEKDEESIKKYWTIRFAPDLFFHSKMWVTALRSPASRVPFLLVAVSFFVMPFILTLVALGVLCSEADSAQVVMSMVGLLWVFSLDDSLLKLFEKFRSREFKWTLDGNTLCSGVEEHNEPAGDLTRGSPHTKSSGHRSVRSLGRSGHQQFATAGSFDEAEKRLKKDGKRDASSVQTKPLEAEAQAMERRYASLIGVVAMCPLMLALSRRWGIEILEMDEEKANSKTTIAAILFFTFIFLIGLAVGDNLPRGKRPDGEEWGLKKAGGEEEEDVAEKVDVIDEQTKKEDWPVEEKEREKEGGWWVSRTEVTPTDIESQQSHTPTEVVEKSWIGQIGMKLWVGLSIKAWVDWFGCSCCSSLKASSGTREEQTQLLEGGYQSSETSKESSADSFERRGRLLEGRRGLLLLDLVLFCLWLWWTFELNGGRATDKKTNFIYRVFFASLFSLNALICLAPQEKPEKKKMSRTNTDSSKHSWWDSFTTGVSGQMPFKFFSSVPTFLNQTPLIHLIFGIAFISLDVCTLPLVIGGLSQSSPLSLAGKVFVVLANSSLLLGILLPGSLGGLDRKTELRSQYLIEFVLQLVGCGGAWYCAWWSMVPVVDGQKGTPWFLEETGLTDATTPSLHDFPTSHLVGGSWMCLCCALRVFFGGFMKEDSKQKSALTMVFVQHLWSILLLFFVLLSVFTTFAPVDPKGVSWMEWGHLSVQFFIGQVIFWLVCTRVFADPRVYIQVDQLHAVMKIALFCFFVVIFFFDAKIGDLWREIKDGTKNNEGLFLLLMVGSPFAVWAVARILEGLSFALFPQTTNPPQNSTRVQPAIQGQPQTGPNPQPPASNPPGTLPSTNSSSSLSEDKRHDEKKMGFRFWTVFLVPVIVLCLGWLAEKSKCGHLKVWVGGGWQSLLWLPILIATHPAVLEAIPFPVCDPTKRPFDTEHLSDEEARTRQCGVLWDTRTILNLIPRNFVCHLYVFTWLLFFSIAPLPDLQTFFSTNKITEVQMLRKLLVVSGIGLLVDAFLIWKEFEVNTPLWRWIGVWGSVAFGVGTAGWAVEMLFFPTV